MKTVYILLSAIFLLVPMKYIEEEEKFDLLVKNVNIIDGTGNPVQENMNLYVRNGKIAEISKDPVLKGRAIKEIDGTGKYLIPGLFEAHAHPSDIDVDTLKRKEVPNTFSTMIHYGVTSTLILGGSKGSYPVLQEMQSSSAKGSFIAPRIYFTSPLLTIEGGHPMKMYESKNWVDGETMYLLKDSTQVRSIIQKAVSNEAAGIKLVVEDGPFPPYIDRMSPELISKVVHEAHSANLPVFAHISDAEEMKICIEAGVDALVHFVGIPIDWERDKGTIDKIVKNDISIITTFMLAKSLIFYRLHPEWLERAEIADIYDSNYINSLKYPGMEIEGRAILKGFTGRDSISLEEMITPMVKDLVRLEERGVNIVLGTDVEGDIFIFPGLSLHEEMELMAIGGMEPLQIIKAATLNAAKMLGIDNEFGSLEEGKYADFVLLEENPLVSISNTLSILKVFKGGQEQPRFSN